MAPVAEHRLGKRHVKDGIGKAAFIFIREDHASSLKLALSKVEARQGSSHDDFAPTPEAHGCACLKKPIGRFDPR